MTFVANEYPSITLKQDRFFLLLPRSLSSNLYQNTIRFVAQNLRNIDKFISIIIGHDYYVLQDDRPFFSTELLVTSNAQDEHRFTGYVDQPYLDEEEYYPPAELTTLRNDIKGLLIYKIEPSSFDLSVGLSYEHRLSPRGNNIVNFLYNLSQNHKTNYRNLETDFANCVRDLVSISTPADPNEPGKLRLKFFDKNDNAYWAEEVSEGVLYFLALLCIVHQPDPPKLLLLEEPEKGIHPRRIREVMDFIFELARMRDIQIILTSHSPYVVDYFADIPECISVFDRDPVSSETIINNAGELIDQSNVANDAKGLPRISYTDALGEYWVSGFLGGVPL